MTQEMTTYDYEAEDTKLLQEERIQVLGQSLERKLEKAVEAKRSVEQRWIEDLRQYNGQYDPDTLEKIKEGEGSQVFVNITRPKANAAEARQSEMLLPTEERNFGILPTPVPELQEALQREDPYQDAMGHMYESQENPGEPVMWKELAEKQLTKSREKAEAMEREIDDQLTESDYHSKAREVIHDASVLGTGVIKGPVVQGRVKKKWKKRGHLHELIMEQELKPSVKRVSPWDFFPDMTARRIQDAEYTFERSFVSKKQLRELGKQANAGYLVDQIRAVLEEDPREYQRTTEHIAQLREISGLTDIGNDARYELWEYHGPVDKEDLRACGCRVDDDPLVEYVATIEFIGDRVIRARQDVLDSGDSLYSVFCYEEDECCIFGYGVPYLLRNPQKVLNASFRMMLDNAALSVGPQIILDKRVKPADGKRKLTPRKIWIKDDPQMNVNAAFGQYSIDSHQAELGNIYQIARLLADEETSLPMLTQGEKSNAPDTASGMSMLLNASNTQLRRIIKRFDDDVTRTLIPRFYEWNMMYNPKEEIKGDYEVDARGSSTLLVKETQQQGIMQMMQFAGHPVFGPITKAAEVYRKAWQSFHVSPDDVVMSDEEIETWQQQMEEQGEEGGDDPRLRIAELNLQDKERARKFEAWKFEQEMEQKLLQMSVDENMTRDQMRTKLGEMAIGLRGKRQLIADEAQIKARFGSGI